MTLEKELLCSYKAEPMEGLFRENVCGQVNFPILIFSGATLPYEVIPSAVPPLFYSRVSFFRQYNAQLKLPTPRRRNRTATGATVRKSIVP